MTRSKNKRKSIASALTIAGSDSGGGAGIQADLKTFAAFGVHGLSAITAVTAQNPGEVRNIQGIEPQVVKDQISAVIEAFKPSAIKTGMLFSAEITHEVARALESSKAMLVIDPVMISTSGALLLKKNAIEALVKFLPQASLLTPNLPEAEYLLKAKIRSHEAMRSAARELYQLHGAAILMKGGHLKGSSAVDIFYDGKTELLLESPYIKSVSTHGTGCTYSAAITAGLALGLSLERAVIRAKTFITQAIAKSIRCNGRDVLNSFWKNNGTPSNG
ncbi:MAG: bifunctional hydroxymethylpyrimidine kinase/phosphomethylpyrimidine kinase [Verrucomicrobiota bacterium]